VADVGVGARCGGDGASGGIGARRGGDGVTGVGIGACC
jgi:hypothetical protein